MKVVCVKFHAVVPYPRVPVPFVMSTFGTKESKTAIIERKGITS